MEPETEVRPDDDRRAFLRKCGSFALVTPPAVTFLLSTSMSSKAIAVTGGRGGDGGGGGGVFGVLGAGAGAIAVAGAKAGNEGRAKPAWSAGSTGGPCHGGGAPGASAAPGPLASRRARLRGFRVPRPAPMFSSMAVLSQWVGLERQWATPDHCRPNFPMMSARASVRPEYRPAREDRARG